MANEVKDELDAKALEAAIDAIPTFGLGKSKVVGDRTVGDKLRFGRGTPNPRAYVEAAIRAYLLVLRPQREDAGAGGGVPRRETTSENIARDIREGRFPKRSAPQEAGDWRCANCDIAVVGGAAEAEAAYGLLWRMRTTDKAIHDARKALIDVIGRDGQRRGIDWARTAFGHQPEPSLEDMP